MASMACSSRRATRALSAALLDLWARPERRAQMRRVAAADVQRFAWLRVVVQILEAYREAIAIWSGSRHSPLRCYGSADAGTRMQPAGLHAAEATSGQASSPRGRRDAGTVLTGCRSGAATPHTERTSGFTRSMRCALIHRTTTLRA